MSTSIDILSQQKLKVSHAAHLLTSRQRQNIKIVEGIIVPAFIDRATRNMSGSIVSIKFQSTVVLNNNSI